MQYPSDPCETMTLRSATAQLEIPNCDDPVFRAWCKACDITPGHSYDVHDVRVFRLQQLLQHGDPTYDPEQDTADDYLTPRGF